jgi:hypothetical protein
MMGVKFFMMLEDSYKLRKVTLSQGRFRHGYILYITPELKELWGDTFICQHCECILSSPIFFNPNKIKLFCEDCVKSRKKVEGKYLNLTNSLNEQIFFHRITSIKIMGDYSKDESEQENNEDDDNT